MLAALSGRTCGCLGWRGRCSPRSRRWRAGTLPPRQVLLAHRTCTACPPSLAAATAVLHSMARMRSRCSGSLGTAACSCAAGEADDQGAPSTRKRARSEQVFCHARHRVHRTRLCCTLLPLLHLHLPSASGPCSCSHQTLWACRGCRIKMSRRRTAAPSLSCGKSWCGVVCQACRYSA
jgi:hypothetical protein